MEDFTHGGTHALSTHLLICPIHGCFSAVLQQELQELDVAADRGRLQQAPAVLIPTLAQSGQLPRINGCEIGEVALPGCLRRLIHPNLFYLALRSAI